MSYLNDSNDSIEHTWMRTGIHSAWSFSTSNQIPRTPSFFHELRDAVSKNISSFNSFRYKIKRLTFKHSFHYWPFARLFARFYDNTIVIVSRTLKNRWTVGHGWVNKIWLTYFQIFIQQSTCCDSHRNVKGVVVWCCVYLQWRQIWKSTIYNFSCCGV